jgi:hypothetical protein
MTRIDRLTCFMGEPPSLRRSNGSFTLIPVHFPPRFVEKCGGVRIIIRVWGYVHYGEINIELRKMVALKLAWYNTPGIPCSNIPLRTIGPQVSGKGKTSAALKIWLRRAEMVGYKHRHISETNVPSCLRW